MIFRKGQQVIEGDDHGHGIRSATIKVSTKEEII